EAAAPGEGLGLPIAGELAAALGASIELAPNPGGSCIRLTVPPQPEPAA
ncbi:hypothetical protein HMPREF0731_2358, partial [Pseudoroseomonas cervicalis ATCC 49957]